MDWIPFFDRKKYSGSLLWDRHVLKGGIPFSGHDGPDRLSTSLTYKIMNVSWNTLKISEVSILSPLLGSPIVFPLTRSALCWSRNEIRAYHWIMHCDSVPFKFTPSLFKVQHHIKLSILSVLTFVTDKTNNFLHGTESFLWIQNLLRKSRNYNFYTVFTKPSHWSKPRAGLIHSASSQLLHSRLNLILSLLLWLRVSAWFIPKCFGGLPCFQRTGKC
jgi:hypothetical protein